MNNAEFTWVLLGIAFAATMVGRFLVRRFAMHTRPIRAYAMLPEMAADAVESARRVHFSLGSSALGATSTVTALTSAEIVYRLTERLAISRDIPLITLSDPMTLPLAQDTLRRAYEYRRTMSRWRSSAAAWFPQGTRSLAFAAGVASLVADANIDSSILLGRFGTELAVIGAGALRYDQGMIVHSDLIEGQAVAFAQAQQVLIGEELYVGPAYLNGSALERGGVFALDVLRWLVIVGILVAALDAAL